jgi:hypothetical protein
MVLNDVKIGFYFLNYEKGWGKKVLLNKAISWFCAPFKAKFNGKWREIPSHCELIFTDSAGVLKMISADCFGGGVRIKNFKPKSEKQWVLMPLSALRGASFSGDLGAAEKAELESAIKSTLGKKYDFGGLFYFFTGLTIFESRPKWFCSELITHFLQSVNFCENLTPKKTSPARLFESLKNGIH